MELVITNQETATKMVISDLHQLQIKQ